MIKKEATHICGVLFISGAAKVCTHGDKISISCRYDKTSVCDLLSIRSNKKCHQIYATVELIHLSESEVQNSIFFV